MAEDRDKKTCPECGFPIMGRAGKIFCSDFCRTRYNNRRKKLGNERVRQINRVLAGNRRILEAFLAKEQTIIHRSSLVKKGFCFDFYTSAQIMDNGETCFCCYDLGYIPSESDQVKLVVTG